jgi:hypothetical protein
MASTAYAKSNTVPKLDRALKKSVEYKRHWKVVFLFDFLTSYKDVGMVYLIGFGEVCLYSLSNDWTAESTSFFSALWMSLCIVTGAHAAIFQLRKTYPKKYLTKYSKI